MSNFYDEIDARSARRRNTFLDLTIEQSIAYLQQLRKDDQPPSMEDLRQAHKRNPQKNPNYDMLQQRFKAIGGFSTLLELAGWAIVGLWKKPDYVNWGVTFMEANDGELVTGRMMNFFSKKNLGPSEFGVRSHFDTVEQYQLEVAITYWKLRQEKNQAWQEKSLAIDQGILRGTLPSELFVSSGNMPLDKKELAVRYAKYKVLETVTPDMDVKTKVGIADGSLGQNFSATYRHYRPLLMPADIEYAALIREVFDDIWPMDEYMERLKLGKEYADYTQECNRKKRAAEKRRSLRKELIK